METSAESRVWFITGASRGLGRAFTEAALAAGDRVVGAARDVTPPTLQLTTATAVTGTQPSQPEANVMSRRDRRIQWARYAEGPHVTRKANPMKFRHIIAIVMISLLAILTGGLMPSAQATDGLPAYSAKPVPQAVSVSSPEMSEEAWECNAGDLCVWNEWGGTGQKCSWTNKDNDWQALPVRCSWSANKRVQSYRNNGQNASFTGVQLFHEENFLAPWHCAPQGTKWNVTGGGVFLQSHQWTSGTC
ncbi:hypothetical protein JOF56_006906 [Kibdelosporangium banguiense]|uniref:Uncharacterized protein n=1 Tax=Kibdelosporangium banguiense TaxID=1365924 RepID=A0ABS4TQ39_9PSEU|nr:peptidase inhibitor family I36 protein [Kibdelosporangium banguiense]MBP2326521.1 hypothetical protein [Kibdelosporangium banguiense]